MKCFKHIAFVFLLAIVVTSCKKETTTTPQPAKIENPYFGSKDGPYVRNFIGLVGNVSVPVTGYIKYGFDRPPLDENQWDEIQKSGGGNYIRFDSLNYGTYYILLKNDSLSAGAIMEINQSSYPKLDVSLQLSKF